MHILALRPHKKPELVQRLTRGTFIHFVYWDVIKLFA